MIIKRNNSLLQQLKVTELDMWITTRVFWVNIAKSEVNLRYRNCSNLFGILRREIEFRYYRCRNSTKSMREKKKMVERENIEFWQ